MLLCGIIKDNSFAVSHTQTLSLPVFAMAWTLGCYQGNIQYSGDS